MNPKSNFLAIILAAGKGSRLNIRYPKPLYKINNIPIIDHIINSITSIGGIDILTVVGYQKEKIARKIKHLIMNIRTLTALIPVSILAAAMAVSNAQKNKKQSNNDRKE